MQGKRVAQLASGRRRHRRPGANLAVRERTRRHTASGMSSSTAAADRRLGGVLDDARSPSPWGSNTGGTFRFTCNRARRRARSASRPGERRGVGQVYPRILLYQQDYNNGGPSTYCEYGDGTDNNGLVRDGRHLVDADHGRHRRLARLPGHTQSYPANGTATSIDVPAGYYDVQSTFFFK